MSIGEIVTLIVGATIVLGSIVTVVVTILNKPSYSYCDKTYKRIDVDEKDYKLLISKIDALATKFDELKDVVESLKNGK